MSRVQMPLISVIIPTFNRANILQEAVDSILRQSIRDYEIIIIDDYSSDATEDIVRSIKDSRIRYVKKSNQLKGIATSRNMGYTLSRGIFVVNQDDDDLSEPLRFERLLEAIESLPFRSIVGSWIWHEYHAERKLLAYPIHHNDIVRKIKRPFNRVGIVAGSVMGRADLFREFGCRTKFHAMEDWDMILRMVESKSVTFYNVSQPLYVYRQNNTGLSFSTERVEANLFLRACENQRIQGKIEFQSIDEYLNKLRQPTLWSLWQKVIRILKRIQLRIAWIN